MGNRAIITIEENELTHPVAIYVQWNGGLESVIAFLEYTYEQFRAGNVYDYHARLTQIVGNFFNDGLSLYCHPATDAWRCAAWCDNGHFHFAFDKDKGIELVMHNTNDDPDYIRSIVAEAKDHEYWRGESTILTQIASAQPAAANAEGRAAS